MQVKMALRAQQCRRKSRSIQAMQPVQQKMQNSM